MNKPADLPTNVSEVHGSTFSGASNGDLTADSAVAATIECRDLYKTFSEGSLLVEVLKGINISIHAGEQVAIMGSSGSGKSTLLHLLGGLDSSTSGEVYIQGKKMSALGETDRGQLRNQYLGFVYQFHHLLPEFTAVENVGMPLLIRGEAPKLVIEKAKEILNKVGLGSRFQHKPAELSGGERQRTAIARALVTDPVCVLADEPTGNLDNKTAHVIYELMLSLNKGQGTSIIMVTHDSELASHMERIHVLENGVLHPA
ncbi:MAG: lipoprotein-releasing ABC transporter ATP-binding protein LolD [Gammaproteobacteria bacterium]|nr:lipoprotein-releasing ABC transporter ATP-binding protein LolD [Gammaproteobacteria bacterium]